MRIWSWVAVVALAACSSGQQLTKNKPPPGGETTLVDAGVPADFDTDKDGLADAADKCPAEAEDVDGFEDTDGCPEADNDGDKVPDSADACPTEPETYNNKQDTDGCPD